MIENGLSRGPALIIFDGNEEFDFFTIEHPHGDEEGYVPKLCDESWLLSIWWAYNLCTQLGYWFPDNLMLQYGEFSGCGSSQPEIHELEVVRLWDKAGKGYVPFPWRN